MEANINLSLVNNKKLDLPFVKGSFRGKNGKYLTGYFLVDSGSCQNIFNGAAQHLLSEDCLTDSTHTVTAVDNKGEKCIIAHVDIALDAMECNERFCVSNNLDFTGLFGINRIIGILGAAFLLKHGLTLNLQEGCLCTSRDFDNEKRPFSFLCPMGYGLQTYGVPVVGIIKDDSEYLCVADSGCNTTTIAQYSVEEGMNVINRCEEKQEVICISGSCISDIAEVRFNLLSMGEKDGETTLVEAEDRINILPDRKYIIADDNESVPPLSGLLSASFMMSQSWILDFKHHVIYAYAA